MVPVVSTARELNLIVPRIEAAVKDELAKAGVEVRLPGCHFLLSLHSLNNVLPVFLPGMPGFLVHRSEECTVPTGETVLGTFLCVFGHRES